MNSTMSLCRFTTLFSLDTFTTFTLEFCTVTVITLASKQVNAGNILQH